MINKIIHYCWFGNKPKPDLVTFCINSWKAKLPDYEIVEWNEHNFDVAATKFTQEAYNRKSWAFVSDYVRAYALYHYGGIYLDTDVEIKHSLDEFLSHGAFTSFECINYPFSALWGARKGHSWPEKVIKYYEGKNHFEQITNTSLVSDLLSEEFGVNRTSDTLQILKEDIYVYPSNYFCLDLPLNYATHHFASSWNSDPSASIYKNHLRASYLSKVLGITLMEMTESQNKIGHGKKENHTYYEVLKSIPATTIIKFLVKSILNLSVIKWTNLNK
jgi:mannosyltransferase OCH1-like enzyme